MAKASTIQAIRDDIEGDGKTTVPFATIEYILGSPCEDDDEFESAISSFVDSKAWVTSYHIDWIDRRVFFEGPFTEPGGP